MDVFSPNLSHGIKQNFYYTFVFGHRESKFSFVNFWGFFTLNHLFKRREKKELNKCQSKILQKKKNHFNSKQTKQEFPNPVNHLLIKYLTMALKTAGSGLWPTHQLHPSHSFCHTSHLQFLNFAKFFTLWTFTHTVFFALENSFSPPSPYITGSF